MVERVAKGAYADVALHQVLQRHSLQAGDRALVTELVYGTIRQQRTLATLIQGFCQQLPPLRVQLVLRLGLYQLRYLDRVPPHAAVHSSVELVKEMGLGGFAKLVNGVLRRYTRSTTDPLEAFIAHRPLVSQLGCRYSFPDELVCAWL
ncbi:16S rRNA (cytosine(967)-C(5))-methyltransferase, partial [Escherichia coli]|nr:16S rRNA (cytosine(967)-C(5))-methyltransferase [Escherichia coli]